MKKYVSAILAVLMLSSLIIATPTVASDGSVGNIGDDFEAVSSVAELEAAGWMFSQGAGNQIEVVTAEAKNGQNGKMLKLTKKAGTSSGISALKSFNYLHTDDIKKMVISYDVRLVNPDNITGQGNGVITFANNLAGPQINITDSGYTAVKGIGGALASPWSWAAGSPNAGSQHNFYYYTNYSGSYQWVTVINTIDYTNNTVAYTTSDGQNPSKVISSQPLGKADSLEFKLDATNKPNDTEYYIDNITVSALSMTDEESFELDDINELKGWTLTPGTGNTIELVTAEAYNGQQSKMLKLTKKAGTNDGISALKNFRYVRDDAQMAILSYRVRLVTPNNLTGWGNGIIKFTDGVSSPHIYIDSGNYTALNGSSGAIASPWSWAAGSPNAGSQHNFYFYKNWGGIEYPWTTVIITMNYADNTVSYTTSDGQNPSKIVSSQPLADVESLIWTLSTTAMPNDTEYYIDDVKIEAIAPLKAKVTPRYEYNSVPSVTFNNPVDVSTLELQNTVQINKPSDDVPLPLGQPAGWIKIVVSSDGKTVSFPYWEHTGYSYDLNTDYRIKLTTGIKDIYGQNLSAEINNQYAKRGYSGVFAGASFTDLNDGNGSYRVYYKPASFSGNAVSGWLVAASYTSDNKMTGIATKVLNISANADGSQTEYIDILSPSSGSAFVKLYFLDSPQSVIPYHPGVSVPGF